MTSSGRRGMAPADLYRLVQVGDARISPDGSLVAYVQTRMDEEKDEALSTIWIVPVNGGESRQFTNGPKRDTMPRWSPDGRRLAFLSERDGKKPQIYVLPSDGGEARQVTSLEEGAGEPIWSPDSRRLAFAVRVGEALEPKESEPGGKEAKQKLERRPVTVDTLRYKFDGIGQFRGRNSQIFTISVDGGEPRRLTNGSFDCTAPAWSPDGSSIAFVSARDPERDFEPTSDIYLVPASGGDLRRLTPSLGPCAAPTWSPDGSHIAYAGYQSAGQDYGAHNNRLWVVDLQGGEPRCLTEGFDRSVSPPVPGMGGVPLLWSQDGREIRFGMLDGGAIHLYAVPASGGAPRHILGSDHRTILGGSASRDGSQLALIASAYNMPSSAIVVSSDGRSERQLTRANEKLFHDRAVSEPERMRFNGPDGGEFEGWLIKPLDFQEGRRYPLLLDIHGGPYGAWGPAFSSSSLTWQSLAAQGWTILYVNPRGSNGYGEEFGRYIRRGWGERDMPDFMAAVDRVIELGIADPERLAVTGYSYGGYMTNWIVGHTNRFRAAVAGASIASLTTLYAGDIPFALEGYFDGPWYEQEELYRRISPVTYVAQVTTPLLLQHAEGDLRCPIGQAEEMFSALRRRHKPVRMVRFPGGSHGLRLLGPPSHQIEYSNNLIEWISRWTLGQTTETRELAGVPADD